MKPTIDIKKIWAFIKACPLGAMLIVSVLVLSLYALFATTLGDYQFSIGMEHPLFASVLNKEYKADVLAAQAAAESAAKGVTKYQTVEKKPEDCPYYNDPGKVALTTDHAYVQVDNTYYNDAVFIGDSRIEGMHDYAGLDNATFYYEQGLTVYTMMTDPIAHTKSGDTVTVPEALKQDSFKKIYIMVGINELGEKTTADYAKQYKANLDEIRSLQPDAKVFIMGVMKMSTAKENNDPVYNNVNINDKNVSVAGYADGVNVFYLDINPAVCDEGGGLIDSYTWDGVHLKAENYTLLMDFLNAHGLPDSDWDTPETKDE